MPCHVLAKYGGWALGVEPGRPAMLRSILVLLIDQQGSARAGRAVLGEGGLIASFQREHTLSSPTLTNKCGLASSSCACMSSANNACVIYGSCYCDFLAQDNKLILSSGSSLHPRTRMNFTKMLQCAIPCHPHMLCNEGQRQTSSCESCMLYWNAVLRKRFSRDSQLF